jgi:hypothetical protein
MVSPKIFFATNFAMAEVILADLYLPYKVLRISRSLSIAEDLAAACWPLMLPGFDGDR